MAIPLALVARILGAGATLSAYIPDTAPALGELRESLFQLRDACRLETIAENSEDTIQLVSAMQAVAAAAANPSITEINQPRFASNGASPSYENVVEQLESCRDDIRAALIDLGAFVRDAQRHKPVSRDHAASKTTSLTLQPEPAPEPNTTAELLEVVREGFARIKHVSDGSPARIAGLQEGDIVARVGNITRASLASLPSRGETWMHVLRDEIASLPLNSSLEFVVFRASESGALARRNRITLVLVLSEWKGRSRTGARLDHYLHARALADIVALEIVRVSDGSPCSDAGLLVGDLLVRFGPVFVIGGTNRSVRTVSVALEKLAQKFKDQQLEVVVLRGAGVKIDISVLTLSPCEWSGKGVLGFRVERPSASHRALHIIGTDKLRSPPHDPKLSQAKQQTTGPMLTSRSRTKKSENIEKNAHRRVRRTSPAMFPVPGTDIAPTRPREARPRPPPTPRPVLNRRKHRHLATAGCVLRVVQPRPRGVRNPSRCVVTVLTAIHELFGCPRIVRLGVWSSTTGHDLLTRWASSDAVNLFSEHHSADAKTDLLRRLRVLVRPKFDVSLDEKFIPWVELDGISSLRDVGSAGGFALICADVKSALQDRYIRACTPSALRKLF